MTFSQRRTNREWLNRDPIMEAGGINLYRFVVNAPTRHVDLYGLSVRPYPPNPWPILWPILKPIIFPEPPPIEPKPTKPAKPVKPGRLPILRPFGLFLCGVFSPTTAGGPEPYEVWPFTVENTQFDPNNDDHQKSLRECINEANWMKEMQEEIGIPWTGEDWQNYVEQCMIRRGFDFDE